jgi:hypothetical protein
MYSWKSPDGNRTILSSSYQLHLTAKRLQANTFQSDVLEELTVKLVLVWWSENTGRD